MNDFLWVLAVLTAIIISLSTLIWNIADLGQAITAALDSVADCIEAWKRIKRSLSS